MEDGKFVADFISANLEKIWTIGGKIYDTTDEAIKLRLRTAYSEYLINSKEKYSKTKSFFIRNEPVDLYDYYVPTGISNGRSHIPTPKFKTCLAESKRIVITGTGGSGKSVLMRHLFIDCMSQREYTPVLIELRDLNNSKATLNETIYETLSTYGFNLNSEFTEKAKKAGHFCFFLDGYDEVDHKAKNKLTAQIKELSNKYKQCPIFISSRPDDVFNGIDSFTIFKIKQLNLNSAIALIKKLPYDQEIKEKFVRDLENGIFEKHKSFLSNPLLLSIMLLTYGENAEIPSKLSIFYNQAYEALFQRHDAHKGGYSRKRKSGLDIQDFSRVFSLFALQTYERRIFKMPRTSCLEFIEKAQRNLQKDFKSEDYLTDLLSAACLLIEDGLEITFSHRSFQEYFVALYISSAPPETQKKLIDRYSKNSQPENVLELLTEINPGIIERYLIIPNLEKVFSEIGVRNKIGITHAAKYIKTVYKSFHLDSDDFTATFTKQGMVISRSAHLAVKLCDGFEFSDSKYFDSHRKSMVEKHGNGESQFTYTLDTLSYKSPFLADTLNGKGAFSTIYVKAIYDSYNAIKTKHDNSESDLDALLGI